ncbi:MAG: hypothetical protein U0326_25130 [Polyangiales bacterium]
MRRALLLVLAIALGGCLRWQRVPVESLRDGSFDLRTRTVRLIAPREQAELVVHRVAGGHVDGWDANRQTERRIDLSRVRDVRVQTSDPVGNALVVGAVYLAVTVVSWLAIVVDAF